MKIRTKYESARFAKSQSLFQSMKETEVSIGLSVKDVETMPETKDTN